jgi:hypothetical protein
VRSEDEFQGLEAMGGVAEIVNPPWRHFGGILSLITCQHFDHYVQANSEMFFL